jgi:hypothetical protein
MNSEYSDDKNKIDQVHDIQLQWNDQTNTGVRVYLHGSDLLKKKFISISSIL